MINSFLLSLLSNKQSLTTYSTGLVQAKAYRILKHRTNEFLSEYNLNSLEWAMLGLLYDTKDGFKLVQLSELLGVEAPFVTVMIDRLEKEHLVDRKVSADDKRVKIITLTARGRKLVPKIELVLKNDMKKLIKGVGVTHMHSYMKVLKEILKNAS